MSAYCTVSQFRSYIQDNPALDPLDDAAIERLLERAGRDVERWLGWPAPVLNGPRIDVLVLTAFEASALARAVCAQSEYRLQRGEDEVAVDRDGVSAAGSVSFSPIPPPRMGPKCLEELSNVGLLVRTGTVPPD